MSVDAPTAPVTEVTAPAAEGNPFEQEPAPDPAPTEFDDVEKQVEHRTWVIEGDIQMIQRNEERTIHFRKEYTQKPLSYLSMIQFTGLLGRKIDEAMQGDEGLSLASISEMADVAKMAQTGTISLSTSDFASVDAFIRGFAKLVSYIPDILDEAQCIWLRVPIKDRMIVREIWGKPVDEGGLSPDDGEAMMDLFLRQNYEELEAFFVKRLRRWGQTIQRERARIHPADSPQ